MSQSPAGLSERLTMIRTASIPALLVLSISVVSGLRLHAECPIPPPPCEALKGATYVFVADLEYAGASSEQVRPNVRQFVPQPVRFQVVEVFKGVEVGAPHVEARIRSDSADAILFRAANRYLVACNS